jgi:hypothetical protein
MDSGDLPGDFQSWLAAGEVERIALHFAGYIDGSEAADGRELITKLLSRRV